MSKDNQGAIFIADFAGKCIWNKKTGKAYDYPVSKEQDGKELREGVDFKFEEMTSENGLGNEITPIEPDTPLRPVKDEVTKQDILDMHINPEGKRFSLRTTESILAAMEEYASRKVLEYAKGEGDPESEETYCHFCDVPESQHGQTLCGWENANHIYFPWEKSVPIDMTIEEKKLRYEYRNDMGKLMELLPHRVILKEHPVKDEIWKEKFEEWLTENKYTSKSGSQIIADYVERYIRPELSSKEQEWFAEWCSTNFYIYDSNHNWYHDVPNEKAMARITTEHLYQLYIASFSEQLIREKVMKDEGAMAWLKREGYPDVMPMTLDNLEIILNRYVAQLKSTTKPK